MRAEIIRLLKAVPFRPFIIVMDSGQRVVIRHSENVALDPTVETVNCYALSEGIMYILPWEKMSSLALADSGEPLPGLAERAV